MHWLERSANLCGGVRLRVPRVNMAGPTHKEQHDATHISLRASLDLLREQFRHGQTHHAESAYLNEITTAKAIAEFHILRTIQVQHRQTPLRKCQGGSLELMCREPRYHRVTDRKRVF